nr:hypothetical protein [Tanacetum cinerariifolium]
TLWLNLKWDKKSRRANKEVAVGSVVGAEVIIDCYGRGVTDGIDGGTVVVAVVKVIGTMRREDV